MIEDCGHGQGDGGSGAIDWNGLVGDEQVGLFGVRVCGKLELDGLCADGEEVAVGALHRHGVGEVDEVDGDGAGVTPEGDV